MSFFHKSVESIRNRYRIEDFSVRRFTLASKRLYKTSKFGHMMDVKGSWFSKTNTIFVHKFFIPELLYLMKKFRIQPALRQEIIENTWVSDIVESDIKNRIDLRIISKVMNVHWQRHQMEFIEQYDVLKQKSQLRGFLLSFQQGLGKTLTSLGLMTGLHKNKIIIIAPKSTLVDVWENEIDKFFFKKQQIFVVNRDKLSIDYDIFLFNYESMDKLKPLYSKLGNESVGVIVDESHNFLRQSSTRTQNLINLGPNLNCDDILLMSGTPVKALGIEVMSVLLTLDRYFDQDAMLIFKRAFGVNTTLASDIISSRLNSMMVRRTKEEVLDLPAKIEETIQIEMKTGSYYNIDNVRLLMKKFVKERFEYHSERMQEYLDEFYEVMAYLSTKIGNTMDFKRYKEIVTMFNKTKNLNMFDPIIKEKVMWANIYEKSTIIPLLPSPLLKKFRHSKSAVKYLNLKIKGEVIGRLLMGLRTKMTNDMVAAVQLETIIHSAMKKTLIFTSYVETVDITYDYLVSKGLTPIRIYGKTKESTKDVLSKFKKNKKINPIIASIHTISTGVTLIEANTVIFLNKPWRHVTYEQASDRVHRIGQDADCYIYSILLETGQPNLSTAMEDIMSWSKDMFNSMMGEST